MKQEVNLFIFYIHICHLKMKSNKAKRYEWSIHFFDENSILPTNRYIAKGLFVISQFTTHYIIGSQLKWTLQWAFL